MKINMETKIAIDDTGKTYNAKELFVHTGGVVEYEGEKYILVEQALPDDVLGKDTFCYTAPAVRVGDEIDEDGWCKRYYVVWKVLEDYDPEWGDGSLACDWDGPFDVYEYPIGYNIVTGCF